MPLLASVLRLATPQAGEDIRLFATKCCADDRAGPPRAKVHQKVYLG